jgi:hypothetical protein
VWVTMEAEQAALGLGGHVGPVPRRKQFHRTGSWFLPSGRVPSGTVERDGQVDEQRCHAEHTVLHPHADAGWLPEAQHRSAMELFASDIAPVLRREIPDSRGRGDR